MRKFSRKKKLDYHNLKRTKNIKPKLRDDQIEKIGKLQDKFKKIIENKMICPNCGNKMEMFGILESGMYKYYCTKCYKIEFKDRKKVYRRKNVV